MRILDGIVIYDIEQTFFKIYELEGESKERLTAASLVAYLLLRTISDSEFLIDEKELNLKGLCREYNLPYDSIYKGMKRLFDLSLLEYDYINESSYIKFSLPANHHTNTSNKTAGFFRLPKYILKSGFLHLFIKSRNVRGLLCFLDLINGLFRKWSTSRSTELKRHKANLFNKFKQTNYAFRNLIKTFFKNESSPIEIEQEIDDFYIFKLSQEAFTERESDKQFEEFNAAIRSMMEQWLKRVDLKLTQSEKKNIIKACYQELIVPMYKAFSADEGDNYNIRKTIHFMINEIIHETLNRIIAAKENVKNLGGYFRKTLRSTIHQTFKQSDSSTEESLIQTLIILAYRAENKETPSHYLK